MNLVTHAEARHHLRIDTYADDPWLDVWIPAVSSAVHRWIKRAPYAYAHDTNGEVILDSSGDPVYETDDNGDPVVLPIVRAAVLVELAQQYRFRDGSGAGAVPEHWGHGHPLGAGATALLAGLHRPVVA